MAQSHGRGTWATRTVPPALFRCSYTAAEREGNRIGAPAGDAGTARWQVFARAGLWVAAAALGRHGLLCADVAASLGQPVPAEMRHRTTTRVVVALVAQDRTSWYPPVACVARLPCPG